jgi:hypothetical protein
MIGERMENENTFLGLVILFRISKIWPAIWIMNTQGYMLCKHLYKMGLVSNGKVVNPSGVRK